MELAERDGETHAGSHLSEMDLVRTGPGTPGGKFMRSFWTAIYRSKDLSKGDAKPIRIMSEDYTLYRGESARRAWNSRKVVPSRSPNIFTMSCGYNKRCILLKS